MTRLCRLFAKILRRMTGRNGTDRTSPPARQAAAGRARIAEQADKTRDARRSAWEARAAVDSFTASVERAMRGQHP
jgi:hypothetical protein